MCFTSQYPWGSVQSWGVSQVLVGLDRIAKGSRFYFGEEQQTWQWSGWRPFGAACIFWEHPGDVTSVYASGLMAILGMIYVIKAHQNSSSLFLYRTTTTQIVVLAARSVMIKNTPVHSNAVVTEQVEDRALEMLLQYRETWNPRMEAENDAAWSWEQIYTVKLDQGVMDKMLLLAISALLPCRSCVCWSDHIISNCIRTEECRERGRASFGLVERCDFKLKGHCKKSWTLTLQLK